MLSPPCATSSLHFLHFANFKLSAIVKNSHTGDRHTGWSFLMFFLRDVTNDEHGIVEISNDRGESHDGDDDKGKSPDGEGKSNDNVDNLY